MTTGLDNNTSDEFRRTGTYQRDRYFRSAHFPCSGILALGDAQTVSSVADQASIALVAAWVYTLTAGGQAPVLRAALGFTLALVAGAAHRRGRVRTYWRRSRLAFCFTIRTNFSKPALSYRSQP